MKTSQGLLGALGTAMHRTEGIRIAGYAIIEPRHHQHKGDGLWGGFVCFLHVLDKLIPGGLAQSFEFLDNPGWEK